MASTKLTRNPIVDTMLEGSLLLGNAALNKGSAFSKEEREVFNLSGLLPPKVNTLDEQVERAWNQVSSLPSDLSKNEFMQSMRVQNIVLYFKLIEAHLEELMGIIYTPTQGTYIQNYSRLFRKPQGCFLDIHNPSKAEISRRLRVFGGKQDIDYIVVTDGEAILGIGDQGVGGQAISASKLALMTACGGLDPTRVIPVGIDCGTNNKALLEDPLYMGNRHERIRGEQYDQIIDNLVQVVKEEYPDAVLHWEDFDAGQSIRILKKYQPVLPTFNDDIQGTGVVTMAALQSALLYKDDKQDLPKLPDIRVLISGAGSAGVGIADQIADTIEAQFGLSTEEARKNIYLIDSHGLLIKNRPEGFREPERAHYAKESVPEGLDRKSLMDCVKKIKPHVLVGCSKQPNSFTKEMILEMRKYIDRPIVIPMSNPTSLHEAQPKDLIEWTDGHVFIATGSPFPPVNGRKISQSNNVFVFPAVGCGAVLSRASHIDKTMLAAAVSSLAKQAPMLQTGDPTESLLPDISDVFEVSARMTTDIVLAAKKAGLATIEKRKATFSDEIVMIPEDWDECYKWVKSQLWLPEYPKLRRVRVAP